MKNILSAATLSASIMASSQTADAAPQNHVTVDGVECLDSNQYPHPDGKINDFAHVLDNDTEANLKTKTDDLEKKTSDELAVVTVTSLQGQTAENYAKCLGTLWGVGKPDKKNGAIYLWAPKERKVWIQVGKGLKDKVNSYRATQILHETTLPSFQQEKFQEGVTNGVDALVADLEKNEDEMSTSSKVAILILAATLQAVTLTLGGINIIPDRFRRSKKTKKPDALFHELSKISPMETTSDIIPQTPPIYTSFEDNNTGTTTSFSGGSADDGEGGGISY